MVRSVAFGLAVFALIFPHITSAQNIVQLDQRLSLITIRSLPDTAPRITKFAPLSTMKGSTLVFTYSSNAPMEVAVLYPIGKNEKGEPLTDPGQAVFASLPMGERLTAMIDVTESPAWSPGRDDMVLQLFAHSEGEVAFFDMAIIDDGPSTVMSALRHLMTGELPETSSVNFLDGYMILGKHFTHIILVVAIFVFAIACIGLKRPGRALVLACFCGIILYDARYSADLLAVTAADLSQWAQDSEYRHLGPIHTIADHLRSSDQEVVLGVCTNESNILEKQLRYLLYPHTVDALWDVPDSATHALMIASSDHVIDGDTLRCADDEFIIQGTTEFSQDTLLLDIQS